ncbi:MAG: GNAT family N-acetyltransferase [Anaerolineae bacterium]|nr:GNAT family N-acetyltransferase [Anaerolineae bacterium]
MTRFEIRRAQPTDMDELARLWLERRDVYLKNQALHEPRQEEAWRAAVQHWITREDAAVLVAERDAQLIGYMVGWVRENLPQVEPTQFGLVSEMSVDGHCKQGGVGSALLQEMKTWFAERKLTWVEVRVPTLQPIEQAFWRSVGAQDYRDHLALRLRP